jgi:hypothetical protein
MFVDGHFYGCISLVQSVAEGITKFLAQRNGVPFKKIFHLTLVKNLKDAGFLSEDVVKRFREIRGSDRDDIHHLNNTIEQDFFELEKRAEACVNALFEIESWAFGYDLDHGALVARFPQYWLQDGQLSKSTGSSSGYGLRLDSVASPAEANRPVN